MGNIIPRHQKPNFRVEVYNTTGTLPVDEKWILTGITSISENRQKGNAVEYVISIVAERNDPLYARNFAQGSFGVLRRNRLVRIYQGYEPKEPKLRFTGNIYEVSSSETKKGIELTVRCQDFTAKCIRKLNENYPNFDSYDVEKGALADPDRVNYVRAYDRWLIGDAIRDMAIKSGIDISLLSKIDRTPFRLNWNLGYPSPFLFIEKIKSHHIITKIPEIETDKLDAPYINEIPYGDSLWDWMQKFADNILYNLYFNELGELIFEPTIKYKYYEENESSPDDYFKDWNTYEESIHLSYSSGKARLLSNTKPTADIYFKGTGIVLVTAYSPFQKIKIKIDGEYIKEGDKDKVWDLDSDMKKGLYGAYFITIDGLEFKNHILTVEKVIIPSLYKVPIDAFIVLKNNPKIPSLTFEKEDITISLETAENLEDIRNEVVVIGSMIGDEPLSAKAVDEASQNDPSALNYIGEKSQVVIEDKNILKQEKVNWLCQAILQRYRQIGGQFEFGISCYPVKDGDISFLNIGQCISINDTDSGLTPNKPLFIESISTEQRIGSWTGRVVVTPYEPVLPYLELKPPPRDLFTQLVLLTPALFTFNPYYDDFIYIYLGVHKFGNVVIDILKGKVTYSPSPPKYTRADKNPNEEDVEIVKTLVEARAFPPGWYVFKTNFKTLDRKTFPAGFYTLRVIFTTPQATADELEVFAQKVEVILRTVEIISTVSSDTFFYDEVVTTPRIPPFSLYNRNFNIYNRNCILPTNPATIPILSKTSTIQLEFNFLNKTVKDIENWTFILIIGTDGDFNYTLLTRYPFEGKNPKDIAGKKWIYNINLADIDFTGKTVPSDFNWKTNYNTNIDKLIIMQLWIYDTLNKRGVFPLKFNKPNEIYYLENFYTIKEGIKYPMEEPFGGKDGRLTIWSPYHFKKLFNKQLNFTEHCMCFFVRDA